MQVNKPVTSVGRPNAALPQAPAPAASTNEPVSQAPRVDQVQISDAGRALLSEPATQSSTLDPDRAQDIRAKVLSGAYLTLDAADQVARAILRSGDV
jgi:hypothetical protein